MSSKRVGLYPGTFDPLTRGHLDIISRGMRLIDHLVVGVAANPDKQPLFTLNERTEMANQEIGPLAEAAGITLSVEPFDGLLTEFARQLGAGIILRGLRAVADFEYEFQMVGMNARLNPEVETVFLMASDRYSFIASRLVKEIAKLNGPIDQFVTPGVAARLSAKFD